MKTYRAELAPFRLKPLHPDFVERARAHARLVVRGGGVRRPAWETTCPYCGAQDQMRGIVRLGAKEQVPDVEMTREGYYIEDARDREMDLLVIHCQNTECQAVIDPLAYIAPATFLQDRTDENVFGDY